MKHSIKKIFDNLVMLWILIIFVMTLAALSTLERNISFKKIDNLNNLKSITKTLINLDKKDVGFALIQFNGQTAKILNNISKLKNLYKIYDFSGKYILDNSAQYMSDLEHLAKLINTFNQKATDYYTKNTKSEELKLNELNNAYSDVNNHINTIIFKNISYEQSKFSIFQVLFILSFTLILLSTLWYRKRLSKVYQDIFFLFAVNSEKLEYEIFSEEVDVISQNMKRKPKLSENKSMIDHITDIYNSKGLFNAYNEKKNLKGDNFTFMSILEIDNFTEKENKFTQDVTHNILKKVAFSISLYEQPSDVIARTGYNQFTIISSRPSKDEAFKEIDAIRQTISELIFLDKDKQSIYITISGGFVLKSDNASLEDSSKEAKKILEHAKNSGKNRIAHVGDLVKK